MCLVMGKNGKKSFYKKQLKPLVKQNKVLLAALGGVATGITIAGILGTEKAKQLVDTIEDSVKTFTDKIKNDGLISDRAEQQQHVQ
jgi:chitinase